MRVKFTVLFTLVTLAVRVSSQAAAPLEFTRRSSSSSQPHTGSAIELQDLHPPSPVLGTQELPEDAPGGRPSTSHTPNGFAEGPRLEASSHRNGEAASSSTALIQHPQGATNRRYSDSDYELSPPSYTANPWQDPALHKELHKCALVILGFCTLCAAVTAFILYPRPEDDNDWRHRVGPRAAAPAEHPTLGQECDCAKAVPYDPSHLNSEKCKAKPDAKHVQKNHRRSRITDWE
ncbi:hypothetical protein C8R42DRAFT_640126 [Lentinula raphanica]|nr:hypothetical protein C8R42DRAFT_640126 [Lentinula raphanica]